VHQVLDMLLKPSRTPPPPNRRVNCHPQGAAHWEVLLRARAIEAQCFVVAAAQTGRHNEKRESYGDSLVGAGRVGVGAVCIGGANCIGVGGRCGV